MFRTDFLKTFFTGGKSPAPAVPPAPPPRIHKDYVLSAFGETRELGMDYPPGYEPLTAEELSSMATRCCACDTIIWPGEPVMLYPGDEAEGKQIGCYTFSCAPPSCLPDGRWMPDPENRGKVRFYPSNNRLS